MYISEKYSMFFVQPLGRLSEPMEQIHLDVYNVFCTTLGQT